MLHGKDLSQLQRQKVGETSEDSYALFLRSQRKAERETKSRVIILIFGRVMGKQALDENSSGEQPA